ncbi:MAG: hypothetical protein PVJ36_06140 [Nitrospirota bacterium]
MDIKEFPLPRSEARPQCLVTPGDGDLVRKARVALGGAAPVPWRSVECEEELTGKRISRAVAFKAAEAAMRKAKPLPKNGYKVQLFKGIIAESLMEILKA